MSVVFLIFAVLALAAAVNDVAFYKIPNAIVLALLFLFIAVAYVWMPLDTWRSHFFAGAGTLVVMALLYAARTMGAGDAKLLAVMALWAGLDGLFPLLFYVSVTAFLGMLALLALRHALPWAKKRGWLRLPEKLPRVLRKGEGVPYAIGIGPGAVIAAATGWFPAWLWQA